MSKKHLEQCKSGRDFVSYAEKRGAEICNGKGSHTKVYTDKGMAVVPSHCSDLPTGTRFSIIKTFVAIGLGIFICSILSGLW